MRIGTLAATWMVAALVVLAGCKRGITVNAGGATPVPATTVVPSRVVYTFAPPLSSLLMAPGILEMMRALGTGVGHDVLIIPTPFVKPTSTLTWTDQTAGLAAGECSGSPIAGGPPAMALVMNTPFALTFANKQGHLAATPLYAAFTRCVGLGLGLSASNDPGDVMGPDSTHAKDFGAFYALVGTLTAAASTAH